MKRYVKQTTQTIHYIADIRMENPNMSIPDDADCSKLGYKFLIETQAPVQEGFVAEEIEPVNNTQQWKLVPVTPYVPSIITARQTRLALLQQGLLDEVETALTQNRAWQIEWEYASEIERTHALVGTMQAFLGISDAQVDALFINGAQL